MEKVAQAFPTNYVYAYTHGAALLRAGQLEEAQRKLTEANTLHRSGGTPYEWLLLAMTHARLGHAEEAKKWLDRAAQWLDQPAGEKPRSGPADDLAGWQTRLELQLLRREAEALVKGPKP
jgi:hypothetical protein